ncbi:hypothetical protein M9Y10_024484 [Tritrichomonas musculus]|uniref:Uncharacterized protein n=1 Tax=Tritrichomonas musculus TaxID=1915356 RepID=A0ABR2HC30_9EUKA
MSETLTKSQIWEEKLKMVQKQKSENDKKFLYLKSQLNFYCRYEGDKIVSHPSTLAEDEQEDIKDQIRKCREEAEIIKMEIHQIKEKIAEARLEELDINLITKTNQ